jgi:membrane-associated phospholipid phosphatase
MNFLKRFTENLRTIFAPRNLIWHAAAIAGTYVVVVSGFDWKYYQFFHQHDLIFRLMSLATALGFFMPVIIPFILLVHGWKNIRSKIAAFAVIQAELLGTLVSGFYKVFTGRAHPQLIEPNFFDVGTIVTNGVQDISHQFHFGFLQGGVIWGWPSTHTTVAFAMALALIALFFQNKSMKWILAYAFYIGLGVAMSIHWFSDFLAGAILGSLIGIIVGRSFRKLIIHPSY